MFGLSDILQEKLCSVFRKYNCIDEVVIYGSRALGTNRENSDIDITLKGTIPFDKLLNIEIEIDDLMLPYKVDLSVYNAIQNKELIEHINRVGKIFFRK